MYHFTCTNRRGTWDGKIVTLKNHLNYYEFTIQSRSSIMVILGMTSRGYFACMPDFNTGCYLSDLADIFWNTERLTKVLGRVDGITVANALAVIRDEILKRP
ncbi:MAG TPA: hypothetical protein GXX14_14550 [Clostridiaceae bacterium]|nr:hypothetical protein [Clostridiaceae bacterium]